MVIHVEVEVEFAYSTKLMLIVSGLWQEYRLNLECEKTNLLTRSELREQKRKIPAIEQICVLVSRAILTLCKLKE